MGEPDAQSDLVDTYTDELPDDLDAAGYVGQYKFPDNSRRRIPAAIYLLVGGASLIAGLAIDGIRLNGGVAVAGGLLVAFGLYGMASGWRMAITERDALVAAQGAVGFPAGHASAQQVWRGIRSRPTWRVLVYSIEEPPRRRGLVLVDAIDGSVVEYLVEDNPADDLGYHESEAS